MTGLPLRTVSRRGTPVAPAIAVIFLLSVTARQALVEWKARPQNAQLSGLGSESTFNYSIGWVAPVRWVVTGGCGFIGCRLVSRLGQDPDNTVRVVDNLSASSRDDLRSVCGFREVSVASVAHMQPGNGVELVVGDIRDADLAVKAVAGADTVVHLAACTGVLSSVRNPRLDCEANVLGTLNYLEAARHAGCRSFVLASSGASLGNQDPPIHERKVPLPISPYGAGKLAGEAYCLAFHGTYGLGTVILRFGNVYGPGSAHKQSVVAKFIRRAHAGVPWLIYGDGQQSRDFIYVDDVVEALIKAARSGLAGQVFQIATGRETTVLELVQQLADVLAEATGARPTIKHTNFIAGEVRRNYCDISKAVEVLGWHPRTDLERGLRETVQWFANRGR